MNNLRTCTAEVDQYFIRSLQFEIAHADARISPFPVTLDNKTPVPVVVFTRISGNTGYIAAERGLSNLQRDIVRSGQLFKRRQNIGCLQRTFCNIAFRSFHRQLDGYILRNNAECLSVFDNCRRLICCITANSQRIVAFRQTFTELGFAILVSLRSLAADCNLNTCCLGDYWTGSTGCIVPNPLDLINSNRERLIFLGLRLGQGYRFNQLCISPAVIYNNPVRALEAEVLHTYIRIQPLPAADYGIAPAVPAAEHSRRYIADCCNVVSGWVRKRQPVLGCNLLQRFEGSTRIGIALTQRSLWPFNYKRYIYQRILGCRFSKVIQLSVVATAEQVVGDQCLQPLFGCISIYIACFIMGKTAARFKEAQQS
ncbi:hypothetical protein D3C76_953120 [compost metagenome]